MTSTTHSETDRETRELVELTITEYLREIADEQRQAANAYDERDGLEHFAAIIERHAELIGYLRAVDHTLGSYWVYFRAQNIAANMRETPYRDDAQFSDRHALTKNGAARMRIYKGTSQIRIYPLNNDEMNKGKEVAI